MRTTLNLDADVIEAARAVADAEGRSLGTVVSDLARRGLMPRESALDEEDGFPVFRVSPRASTITQEMVGAALEEG
ncbi:MAG: antitoxin [Candidatus Dormibacteria bacterium]|jgi:hypothetical protein